VLAALVLALDLDLLGRVLLVPDAHRRLGLVDVLSAGAAGPHRLDDEVVLLDLDLDGVGFGQDGDGGRGGVDAALSSVLGTRWTRWPPLS